MLEIPTADQNRECLGIGWKSQHGRYDINIKKIKIKNESEREREIS